MLATFGVVALELKESDIPGAKLIRPVKLVTLGIDKSYGT